MCSIEIFSDFYKLRLDALQEKKAFLRLSRFEDNLAEVITIGVHHEILQMVNQAVKYVLVLSFWELRDDALEIATPIFSSAQVNSVFGILRRFDWVGRGEVHVVRTEVDCID